MKWGISDTATGGEAISRQMKMNYTDILQYLP